MFTGLVEATGIVTGWEATPNGARLRIATPLAAELAIGDSIAVNGCCLTVVERARDLASFEADVTAVTLSVTNLNAPDLQLGNRVNLERPLRLGDRLGGHLVTGHVDGVATVLAREPLGDGDTEQITIALPPAGRPLVVPKGSIAVDGVSLTVVDVSTEAFTIVLIPHTKLVTTLAHRAVLSHVNLEYDMLGKYALNRVMEAV